MALFSRIFEYLDLEPELTEATQPAQLADASLTLQHVSYRYPGTDTDALSDVSLSIPAHTTTALVGHTGSGKSTVAALLRALPIRPKAPCTWAGSTCAIFHLSSARRSLAWSPRRPT